MPILTKLYGYLLAAGGLILAALAALGLAKRAGKKEEQGREVEQALKDAKDANAIDTEIHNLSDAELDKRLSESTRKE